MGDVAEGRQLLRAMSSAFAMPSVDPEIRERIPSLKVVSFLYFRGPLDLPSTISMLRERLCVVRRFRSRPHLNPESRATDVSLIELPEAEMERALPRLVEERHDVKSQGDVDRLVSSLAEEPWDPRLPLWRCLLLQRMGDGRSALMMVIDHSLGDGVALVQTLMSMLDPAGGVVEVPVRRQAPPSVPLSTQLRGLFQACWGPVCGDQMPADPPNRLKSKDNKKPGKTKAVAVTEVITMKQIKEVQACFKGSTVNDVLMTLTALTLQEYFRRYEPDTLNQKVRGNFPINMRPVTGSDIMTEEHFGNRFSQGQLRFPLSTEDPVAIMKNIKDQIDLIKASPEPAVRDSMISCLVLKSGLPRNVLADVLLDAFGKVTAMLSNVPGPLQPVHLLGQEVDDMGFYLIAPIGLYFGIVQYKGNFKVGIACDAASEPEPWRLAECWPVAFGRLREAVRSAAAE